MPMTVQAPPTSPRRESSSPSDIRTPTLSKAPRRSFLSRVPSLLMSINLKQSLYIWSCSSEKPPSFWPLAHCSCEYYHLLGKSLIILTSIHERLRVFSGWVLTIHI